MRGTLRIAAGLAVLLGLGCAADKTEFSDRRKRTRSEAVNPLDPGTSSGDAQAGKEPLVSTIYDSESSTNEIFYLGMRQDIAEEYTIATEPLAVQMCTLKPGAATTERKSVRTDYDDTFRKKAPIQKDATLPFDDSQKRIDLFITFDNSEVTQEVVDRAKDATERLVRQLSGYNWKLFMGGLVGNEFLTRTHSKGASIDDDITAIRTKVNEIYNNPSNGVERVFYSLNKLVEKYSGNDQDFGVHAYVVVADAPNCKNFDNKDSNLCNRSAGQWDNHAFLLNNHPNLYRETRENLSIFGAVYRQTNTSKCSSSDSVEAPENGETLKLNSQYAEAAYQFEKSLYPSGGSQYTQWLSDLCSATEDTAWASRFASAVMTLADRRFDMKTTADNFPNDPGYNQKVIEVASNNTLAASEYAVRAGRIVVLNQTPNNTDVKTIFHKNNDYDKLVYSPFFRSTPVSGSVVLTYQGGPNFACVGATSFSGQPANVKCRYDGRDLALRDLAFLPDVNVGQSDLIVTVSYKVDRLRELQFERGTSPVLLSTFSLTGPAAAASLIQSAVVRHDPANANRVIVTFSNDLPDGDYDASYLEAKAYPTTCAIQGSISARANETAVCFRDGAKASMNDDGVVTVAPESAVVPCAFSVGGAQATFNFSDKKVLDPVTATGDDAKLNVAFNALVEPRKTFPFQYPPEAGTVTVTRGEMGGTLADLDAAEFEVTDNILKLREDLQPGEQIKWTYTFVPPVTACHHLFSRSVEGYPYQVFYGKAKDVKQLGEGEFTVKESDDSVQICLADGMAKQGYKLLVKYIDERKHETN